MEGAKARGSLATHRPSLKFLQSVTATALSLAVGLCARGQIRQIVKLLLAHRPVSLTAR
jgi:hypothetical protein